MTKHTQSLSAIENIVNNIQYQMNNENKDIVVSTKRQSAHIINPFVMLFYENLETIIEEYKLTGSDVRVLLRIMKYMLYGNQLNMTFAALAKDMKMDKANMQKIKNKLFKANILISENGFTYVNPHIIAKGDWADSKSNKDNVELLNKAYDIIQDSSITPSISTQYIKEKERNKKIQKENTENIQSIIKSSTNNDAENITTNNESTNDILSVVEDKNPLKKKVQKIKKLQTA